MVIFPRSNLFSFFYFLKREKKSTVDLIESKNVENTVYIGIKLKMKTGGKEEIFFFIWEDGGGVGFREKRTIVSIYHGQTCHRCRHQRYNDSVV